MTSAPSEFALTAGDLRLRLVRRADRYQQLLEYQGLLVAQGCETPGEAWWPESCPLQEVHRETGASGPVLLAVGHAGSAHWSASFLVQAASDNAKAGVRFDFAVRLRQTPERLQVSYSVPAEAASKHRAILSPMTAAGPTFPCTVSWSYQASWNAKTLCVEWLLLTNCQLRLENSPTPNP